MSNLLGLIVFLNACVLLYMYMQVHVPVCGVQMTFLGVIIRNILGDRVLHWLRAHQLGWSGWPVSSSHHLWCWEHWFLPLYSTLFLHGFKLGSSCLQDKRFVNWSILALGIEFCRLSNNGPVKRFPYLALTVKLTEAIFLSFMRYCWPCVIFYFLLKHAIFGWLLPYILFS